MEYNEYLEHLAKRISSIVVWLDRALPIEPNIVEAQDKLRALQKEFNAEINKSLEG